jgi:hypothetical protein
VVTHYTRIQKASCSSLGRIPLNRDQHENVITSWRHTDAKNCDVNVEVRHTDLRYENIMGEGQLSRKDLTVKAVGMLTTICRFMKRLQ